MTVALIISAWWLLLAFMAWVMCRSAADGDRVLDRRRRSE